MLRGEDVWDNDQRQEAFSSHFHFETHPSRGQHYEEDGRVRLQQQTRHLYQRRPRALMKRKNSCEIVLIVLSS